MIITIIFSILVLIATLSSMIANHWQTMIIIAFLSIVFILLHQDNNNNPLNYDNMNIVTATEIQNNSEIPVYYEHSNDEENIRKGNEFEEYVVNLFPETDYTIVEWTTDIMRKHHRFVEADTRPDLLIRHNLTGNEFYVECKYRSYAFENKIKWTNTEQLRRYYEFAGKKQLPVFVIIGLAGTPTQPQNLFCLPLKDAKYTELCMGYAREFQRPAEKRFNWNGTMIY